MAELAELAVKLTDEVNDVYERQEMINGKIYMQAACSATNHNRIVRNLSARFYTYLRGKKCESFGENMKVVLNNKNYFIPDLMIVCDPDKIKDKFIDGAPDLVVEVLSPSTNRNDRISKKYAYEKAGVREYWIISPLERSIEIYYLENGEYMLAASYIMEDDETDPHYNAETEVTLKAMPSVCMRLREIFEDVE